MSENINELVNGVISTKKLEGAETFKNLKALDCQQPIYSITGVGHIPKRNPSKRERVVLNTNLEQRKPYLSSW